MSEQILNKKVFYQVEDDLGIVTDFEIVNTKDSIEINYKSNGKEKKIISTDKSCKILLQCFIYCASHFSLKPIVGVPYAK